MAYRERKSAREQGGRGGGREGERQRERERERERETRTMPTNKTKETKKNAMPTSMKLLPPPSFFHSVRATSEAHASPLAT